MAITQVAPARQDIGANNPPATAAEALRQRLTEDSAALIKRKDALVAAVANVPATIEDEETAGKVSDFILQIGAAYNNAEKVRVTEKEVFLEGGHTVDGFFKGLTAPLLAAKKEIEGRLTVYHRKKADEERSRREEAFRQAQELADRQRREAEARASALQSEGDLPAALEAEAEAKRKAEEAREAADAAAAKPADLSRTRGDYGAVASLRTTWTYEVTDEAAVPHAFLMVNDAAIKAHIKNRAKDQPPSSIAGIKFIEQTSTVVR